MKKILIITGSVLGVLIVAIIVLMFTLGSPAKAEEPTTSLEVRKGDVEINGSPIKVGTDLKAGDEIKTGADSEAVVNFFDKSTARIDQNTTISISNLSSSNQGAKTEVGIKVTVGRIWSRVVKLVDKESKYEVETPTTVATVRGTSFDTQVGADGKEKMDVGESFVSQVLKDPKNQGGVLATQEVLAGNSAQIDEKNLPSSPQDVLGIVKAAQNDAADTSGWIAQNQLEDKVFEQEVATTEKENLNQKAGITSDSSLYALKKIAQGARIALALSKDSKAELNIEYANQKLAEAGKLLSVGKQETAKNILQDYSNQIDGALKNINPDNSAKIEDLISSQKNLVATVLPDDPLYDIKKKIESAQIASAADSGEKVAIELDNAKQRLVEAGKLVEENKNDIAQKTLEDYSNSYVEVKALADSLTGSQTDVINNIKDKSLESSLYLKTLAGSAPDDVKAAMVEQGIKAEDQANQAIGKDPTALIEFQQQMIRNGTAEIPAQYLNSSFVPDWAKNLNSQREAIIKEILSKLPSGAVLPSGFVIPNFNISVKSGDTLDISKFIPTELPNANPPAKDAENAVSPKETPALPNNTTPPQTNTPDNNSTNTATTNPPSDNNPPTPPPPPADPNKLDSIIISPASTEIKSGAITFFKATAVFGDGHTQDVTAAAVWTVNYDTGTGVIDPGGRFIAGGIGDCTVSATYQGVTGTSGTINITTM